MSTSRPLLSRVILAEQFFSLQFSSRLNHVNVFDCSVELLVVLTGFSTSSVGSLQVISTMQVSDFGLIFNSTFDLKSKKIY